MRKDTRGKIEMLQWSPAAHLWAASGIRGVLTILVDPGVHMSPRSAPGGSNVMEQGTRVRVPGAVEGGRGETDNLWGGLSTNSRAMWSAVKLHGRG